MNNRYLPWLVVIVAFLAGYAVVSLLAGWLIRKFKTEMTHRTPEQRAEDEAPGQPEGAKKD